MSVVVRFTAEISNWIEPSRVELDYGEITDDLFDLDDLLKGSDIDPSKCVINLYALSDDCQWRHHATHMVALTLGADPLVGKMVLMEKLLDGPFLLMLAQGTRLKGFHCDECAKQFVKWFTDTQNYWRENHHASRSPLDKISATSIH